MFQNLIALSFVFFFIPHFVIGQPKSDPDILREDVISYHQLFIECDRTRVIQEFQEGYLNTLVSTEELDWTGNVDECIEGQISELAMNRTRDRINYFRKLVGISNDVVFTDEKNKKSQKAVLMMDAENMLDHYPTMEWKCASEEGIQAAGKSNLSYGGHSSASIPQYIRDAGTNNGAVGHRRWILYPKAYEFGFGSTNWGTAMWVIGGTKNPESYPEFVAYPSPGYFPKPLVYPRWSFSKKGANFLNAKVSMKNEEGIPIVTVVEEVVNGYGDNTIVWQPEINLYDNKLGTDHFYKVSIDSIKVGGEYMSYNYEVMAIDMVVDQPLITKSLPSCSEDSGSISLEITTGYQSIEWSNGITNQRKIENLGEGSYSVTITDKLGCTKDLPIELPAGKQPKHLQVIDGNSNTFGGSTENYSVEIFDNGTYEWDVMGGTIEGDNSSNEIAVRWNEGVNTGAICVIFHEMDGCQSNQICQEIELTLSSIDKLLPSPIKIFPNPSSSNLTIQGDQPFTQVVIADLGGKIILLDNFTETAFKEIDVSTMTPGIYFLKIKSTKGISVSKFSKN